MMTTHVDTHQPNSGTQQQISERHMAALMGLIAASLAVFATLHLTGILGGGSKPFRPDDAGIAEAITAVVLAYGSVVLLRTPGRARVPALVATGFAIVSFIVGLSFTSGEVTSPMSRTTPQGFPCSCPPSRFLWWKTKRR